MRKLFAIVCLLLMPLYGFASASHLLETRYFFDSTADKQLSDIVALQPDDWTESEDNVIGFHFLQSEYYEANLGGVMWVMVHLKDTAQDEKVWLELMPNVGHDGEIAVFENNAWRWQPAVGRPGNEMSAVPTRFLTFIFDPQTHGHTAYIKLNTQQIFNFYLQAKPLQQMISEKVWHTLSFGFIAGALLLALVYNGVIGYTAKEKVYNYYAVYVFCVVVYITCVAGYIRVWFPDWEGATTLTNLSVLTVMSSVILFARELLDTKLILAKLDRVMRITQYALLLGMAAIVFGPKPLGYYVSEVFGMSIPVLVLLVALFAVGKNHPMAKYFLGAWLLIIVIAAFWSWMWLGLINPSQGLVNLLLAGVATEVLLLALVLGLKFSHLKEQTELLRRDKKKFKFLSEVDELTGLLNRRGFMNRVNLLVKARKQFVWLALDIDHFKRFNDQHGHLVGDQLLMKIGAMLKHKGTHEALTDRIAEIWDHSKFKPDGIVGRMGGEEFAMVLVDCPLHKAEQVADRLREACAKLSIKTESGDEVSASLSIGGTLHLSGEPLKRTWKRADDLLYEAKNQGRDRAILA